MKEIPFPKYTPGTAVYVSVPSAGYAHGKDLLAMVLECVYIMNPSTNMWLYRVQLQLTRYNIRTDEMLVEEGSLKSI